ncbi:MAG: cytochrome P450, partial [Angustibacter sp.]
QVAFPLPSPVLLVTDPAGVRRVLLENPQNYTKQTVQYGSLSAVTGAGLLTADAELWRAHRKIAQPAFHRDTAAAVAAQSRAAADRLTRDWRGLPASGAVVDFDAAAMQATLEVVGQCLFAADLRQEGAELVEAITVALHAVIDRAQLPLPTWLWPGPIRRQRRSIATLDRVCANLVHLRRERGIRADDADLLALLLSSDLSPQEVRDEVVTAVIAGHETVASALTWACRLLAENPHVQDELAAEARAAGSELGWDQLRLLPKIRQAVDESLRLYPPAWVVTRRSLASDEVAGVHLPAGTLVILSPWLTHRRAGLWPEPERFDPGRFAAAGAARPRAEYFPFGAGPRLCIGREFALVESVLMLAALLRDWQLRPPTGGPRPPISALVTLRPRGGLPLHVSRRAT